MGSNDTDDGSDEPVHETTPSTKLVRLWLVATLLVGLPATGYLLTVRDAFGTEGFGGVAGLFVGLLTVVGVGRYVVRWLVLRRTTYLVTDTAARREYDLLYKSFARELPLEMLRSVELSRSRSETLLGLGTVRLLTTGASRSMGYLGFDNVADPEALRDVVREQRGELVDSNEESDGDRRWAPAEGTARVREAGDTGDRRQPAPERGGNPERPKDVEEEPAPQSPQDTTD